MLQSIYPECFICFIRYMSQVCLSRCCICFTHIASVLSRCCVCLQWFSIVSYACFECFICLFFMLQVLYLDVSKVDQVLHMGFMWEVGGGASGPPRATRAPVWAWVMQAWSSDVRAARAASPRVGARNEGETDCSRGRPNGRLRASGAQLINTRVTKILWHSEVPKCW